MKLFPNNLTTICTAILASHLLSSCSVISSKKHPASTQQSKTLVNTVDKSALKFKAQYGTEYQISGNAIAKYQHFDLSLFSKKTVLINTRKTSTYIYELTSKDGFGKTHISCDPRTPEKKHFFLEGLHFYYHSNNDGSINIYMPPQLMASR